MCNGDAWGQRHAVLNFVLTVTFVEFLVLTSRGMGAGRKAGTTTCRCPDKLVTVVKHMVLELHGRCTGVNEACGVPGCLLIVLQVEVDTGTEYIPRGNWARCCAGGSGQGGNL